MILSGNWGSAGQTDFTMVTSPPFFRELGRISRDETSPPTGVRYLSIPDETKPNIGVWYLKIPDEQNPTKEGSGDDDTSLLDTRGFGSNVSGVNV
jgi:hypothetical protein